MIASILSQDGSVVREIDTDPRHDSKFDVCINCGYCLACHGHRWCSDDRHEHCWVVEAEDYTDEWRRRHQPRGGLR